MSTATIIAGIPAINMNLYRRTRFGAFDPAAIITLPAGSGPHAGVNLIVRDVELPNARAKSLADRIFCPADFAPAGGLSGDREIATAQSCAEFLRRAGVKSVRAHRSMPLIFAEVIGKGGIGVECDAELGVRERRSKDEQEVAALRKAQKATEDAIRMACELIARAEAGKGGVLRVGGEDLTAERVRTELDMFLLKRNFTNVPSIIAGRRAGADCHNYGTGPLYTGEPIIVDVFPRDNETHYYGDCTRMVVHGQVPPIVSKMHAVVKESKAAAIAATRAGVTGEFVHNAAIAVISRHGYTRALPSPDRPDDFISIQHGTGHGIGLDPKEPPLLEIGGSELIEGDCVTVEPGLYGRAAGGMRLEDMVIVRKSGCDNLNTLHEGLEWK